MTLRPALLASMATLRGHDRQNEPFGLVLNKSHLPRPIVIRSRAQQQHHSLPGQSPMSSERSTCRFGDTCACRATPLSQGACLQYMTCKPQENSLL